MKTFEGGLREAGLYSGKEVAIGIDQSYTGFAIAAVTEDGTYRATVYTGEGKGVKRLVDIQQHLDAQIRWYESAFRIKDIAMEGYAPGSKFGREMAGELAGMVKMHLYLAFMSTPLIVSPSSLKKYATGKGTVKKQQVMLHVFKKWGVEMDDDNAADAYVLARIACGLADHVYEREVLGSLHREVC